MYLDRWLSSFTRVSRIARSGLPFAIGPARGDAQRYHERSASNETGCTRISNGGSPSVSRIARERCTIPDIISDEGWIMVDSGLFEPDARWYVVRTHPREEMRAALNLGRGAIETFLPRIHARRRRGPAAVPLFPQYLFARFDAAKSLHDVSFTRGVQNVIHFGAQLAAVDDEVIALFRERMDASGLIHVGDPLRAGDRVTIEEGPFAALAGVVERRLSDRERVVILLTTVHAAVRVEVSAEDVRRTSAFAR